MDRTERRWGVSAMADRLKYLFRLWLRLLLHPLAAQRAPGALAGRVSFGPDRAAVDKDMVDAGGRQLPHYYFYYLRDLGPWLEPRRPTEARLYASLRVANRQRPVLVTESRFRQLAAHGRAGPEAFLSDVPEVEGLTGPDDARRAGPRSRSACTPAPGRGARPGR